MSEDVFDEFGKVIIAAVRDKDIAYWDNIFKEKKLPPFWEKYRDALLSLTPAQLEFLNEVSIETIDGVIHDLLLILDDKWITIKVVDETGTEFDVKKLAKGGLQGYISEWAKKYSKYPSNEA